MNVAHLVDIWPSYLAVAPYDPPSKAFLTRISLINRSEETVSVLLTAQEDSLPDLTSSQSTLKLKPKKPAAVDVRIRPGRISSEIVLIAFNSKASEIQTLRLLTPDRSKSEDSFTERETDSSAAEDSATGENDDSSSTFGANGPSTAHARKSTNQGRREFRFPRSGGGDGQSPSSRVLKKLMRLRRKENK